MNGRYVKEYLMSIVLDRYSNEVTKSSSILKREIFYGPLQISIKTNGVEPSTMTIDHPSLVPTTTCMMLGVLS